VLYPGDWDFFLAVFDVVGYDHIIDDRSVFKQLDLPSVLENDDDVQTLYIQIFLKQLSKALPFVFSVRHPSHHDYCKDWLQGMRVLY